MSWVDEYKKALGDIQTRTGTGSGSSSKSNSSSSSESSSSSWVNEYRNALNKYNSGITYYRTTGNKPRQAFGSLAPTYASYKPTSQITSRMTVGNDKKKKDDEDTDKKWYQKGHFEDGWDFGDITKTILGVPVKKELKTFEAPDTTDSLEVLKQKSDYYNSRLWNNTEQLAASNKHTQQYNQMALAEYSETLSKTKMDGTNHTVLDEIEILANMKSGKEKNERKQAVLDKMESLGMDTTFYAHFAGDGEFNWSDFGNWIKSSAYAGMGSFNKMFTDTADVLLGAPLKEMGWENNPVSKLNEHYTQAYENAKYNQQLYAEKLGGGAWNFGGDAFEGTVAALPSALLAMMTGGTSLTATSSSLATNAAYQTGSVLTKAGITTETMMKNPQYWTSFAQSLGPKYKEAKEKGVNDSVAAVGAVLSSMATSGIEIGIDGGSGIQGLPSDLLEEGGNKFWKLLESAFEEGGEEGLQKLVEEGVSKFVFGLDDDYLNPIEYGRDMALGSIAGLALGGGQVASQSAVDAMAKRNTVKDDIAHGFDSLKTEATEGFTPIVEQTPKVEQEIKPEVEEVKPVVEQTEVKPPKTNITESTNGQSDGETYFTMSYEQDGKVVGTVQYGDFEGKPNVKMIEVDPEYRRQGIGTKLLQELQKKYPDIEIDFGMSTEDGSKLIDSATYSVENKEVTQKIARIEEIKQTLSEYDKGIEEFIDNDMDVPEDYAADYNDLYDEMQVLEEEIQGKKPTSTFVKTDEVQDIVPEEQSVEQVVNEPVAADATVSETENVAPAPEKSNSWLDWMVEERDSLRNTLMERHKNGLYDAKIERLAKEFNKLNSKIESMKAQQAATDSENVTSTFDSDAVTSAENPVTTEDKAKKHYRDSVLDYSKLFNDDTPENVSTFKALQRATEDAQNFISKGADGVKGVPEIFGKISADGNLDAFEEYLHLMLNVDGTTLDQRLGVENNAVFDKTAEESLQEANRLLEEHPEFKQAAEDVYAFNNYNLDMSVKGGRFTQEQADHFRERYPHYVPISRSRHGNTQDYSPLLDFMRGQKAETIDDENIASFLGDVDVATTAHKRTASGYDFNPLIDTMVNQAFIAHWSVAKNQQSDYFAPVVNEGVQSAPVATDYVAQEAPIQIPKEQTMNQPIQSVQQFIPKTTQTEAPKNSKPIYLNYEAYAPGSAYLTEKDHARGLVDINFTINSDNTLDLVTDSDWYNTVRGILDHGLGYVYDIFVDGKKVTNENIGDFPGYFNLVNSEVKEKPVLRQLLGGNYDIRQKGQIYIYSDEVADQIRNSFSNIDAESVQQPYVEARQPVQQEAPIESVEESMEEIVVSEDVVPSDIEQSAPIATDNVAQETNTEVEPDKVTINLEPDNEYVRADDFDSNKLLENRKGIDKVIHDVNNAFQEYILDHGFVFEKKSKKVGNRALEAKWHANRNASASAQHFIGNGNGDVRAVTDILKEVKKSGLQSEFYSYLGHLRNMDGMSLQSRYGVANNQNFMGRENTFAKSTKAIKKLEEAHPEFKKLAEDVYKNTDYILDQFVERKMITQDDKDLIKELYPHYIPMRYSSKGEASAILETLAQFTNESFSTWAMNDFGVELKNTLNTEVHSEPMNIDSFIKKLDSGESMFSFGEDGEYKTFTVYEDGQLKTFDIDSEMYMALSDSHNWMNMKIPVLHQVNEGFRKFCTEWNIFFSLKNGVKDPQDIMYNSQHPIETYAELTHAGEAILFEESSYRPYYEEYLANGGEPISYFDSGKQRFTSWTDPAELVKYATGLNAVEAINNRVETNPRLAEYIASRKMGKSVQESMLDAARVTTNFAAGGKFTKFLNRNGCTFLNASVQGALQHARNFVEAASDSNGKLHFDTKEAKIAAVKGTTALITRAVVTGMAAIAINDLRWKDDEDYEALPDYVKDGYYLLFKYGDGQFFRLPKGRTNATIEKGLRTVAEASFGDDNADWNSFFDVVLENIAPNSVFKDNILAPIREVGKGETWYGEDMIPYRLKDEDTVDQFDEKTDTNSINLSKKLDEKLNDITLDEWLNEKLDGTKLGEKLAGFRDGLSPKEINYLINSYTGVLGDLVLPYYTPKAESSSDNPLIQSLAPLKDIFTTDSVLNNRVTGDFYETLEAAEAKADSENATLEDKLKSGILIGYNVELSDLYEEQRNIQMDENLSDSEKYERTREIKKEINALQEKGLKSLEDYSIDGNYAESGEKRYNYDAEDDTWWEVKPKLADGRDNWYYTEEQMFHDNLGVSYSDYWNGRLNPEDYDVKTLYDERNGKRYNFDMEKNAWFEIAPKLPDGKDNYYYHQEQRITKDLGISYEEYWNNREMYDDFYYVAGGYDKESSADDTIETARTVFGYERFAEYAKDLKEIKEDKDKNGESISGTKYPKVQAYVNSLDIPDIEKKILYTMQYPNYKKYKREIVKYLDQNDDISYDSYWKILDELGYKYDSKGYVTW